MLLDNAFKCTFKDCFLICLLTAMVTLLVAILIHVYLYFRLAKVAENIYGDEPINVHNA
jgi:hypothetical protein